MHSWITGMPPTMKLKSEGFASSLSEPTGRFTLGAYCASNGIPYQDTGLPVGVKTFIDYGQEFQRRFAPNLEQTNALSVRRSARGFDVELEHGQKLSVERIVVASGIMEYASVPDALTSLPSDVCTHSGFYANLRYLPGQRIAIVGAGSSAMDMAAFLKQQGLDVIVIARRPVVRFQTPLGSRSVVEKLRAPMTTIGPGWKSVLCTHAPLVFHSMPTAFRVDVVRRYLGPAPAWFTREAVEGRVPIITDATVGEAAMENGRVRLRIDKGHAEPLVVVVDRVIAATGYRVDVDRLSFLDREIRLAIRRDDCAPRLSMDFQSSVPGLYFVGTASANSFGPMLRFACGAGFAARRVARYLKATRIPKPYIPGVPSQQNPLYLKPDSAAVARRHS